MALELDRKMNNLSSDGMTPIEALYPPPKFSAATQSLLDPSTRNMGAEAIRSRAEHRLLELEHEIMTVKAFRNTCAATSALPAEVLSSIFILISSSSKDGLSWLPITQICRQWRAIALGCPAVWSYFTFKCSPALTELMLSRSKMTPISVMYRSPHLTSCAVFKKVISQVDRLRSIEAITEDSRISHQAGVFLQSDFRRARLLETFILRGRVSRSDHTFRFDRAHVPEAFLQSPEGFASLTHLEIEGCYILWKGLPTAPGLIRLGLHNKSDYARPLPQPFLNSLTTMTCLQHLALSRFLPCDKYILAMQQRVRLPALQSLWLDGSLAELTYFFAALQLPNNTPITVRCHSDAVSTRRNESAAFLAALNGVCNRPALQDLWLKNFGRKCQEHAQMMCWYGDLPAYDCDEKSATLNVQFPSSGILASLAQEFDFCSLRVQGYSEIDASDWEEVFSRLTKLETITIWEDAVDPLIEAMKQDPALLNTRSSNAKAVTKTRQRAEKAEEATVPQPFFPALQTLRLYKVDLLENRMGKSNDNIIDDIWNVLGRRPHSHTIKTLDIKQCSNFSSKDFKKLRGAVPELKWDGDYTD